MDPVSSDIQYNGVMAYRRGYRHATSKDSVPLYTRDDLLREVCKYPPAERRARLAEMKKELRNGTWKPSEVREAEARSAAAKKAAKTRAAKKSVSTGERRKAK